MTTMAILVASLMVATASPLTQPPAVTVEKHVFTQGTTPMSDCRKMEANYHTGNGEIIKRGNKSLSQTTSADGKYVYETLTFCVEI